MNAGERLDAAFEAARRHYEEILGRPLAINLRTLWIDAAEFWAVVEPEGEGYLLRVTTGLVEKTAQLWADAFANAEFLAGAGQPMASDADQMTQVSLVWMMLHELHHIDLNHFELTGGFSITETRNTAQLNVSQRASPLPNSMAALPADIRKNALLCLELQADHDASEMLLENYSPNELECLRYRAMAVSGMMMLIECEDAKNGDEGKTHPKAATRIFQLLGHLSELPLIPAQLGRNASLIPDAEELQGFAREVSIPCIFDAIRLAQIAGASSIESDLGEPQDFFQDLGLANLSDPSRYTGLKTQGAKEWAMLWPCNEVLKPILSVHKSN